jgi:aminoglycoside 3-N-acetyltransferase
VVRALKAAVGEGGLLVMPSMPYHNMSSAQWLAKGKPMNVLRSPSMMGLVSEVFRRSEGVQRSLSLTHPLLAWGRDAAAFVEGHERAERPSVMPRRLPACWPGTR